MFYIPDPVEILDAQIERNIDNFAEGCCMVCGKNVDYELIPASSHPAALAVCFECLSPEDQKSYNQFFESQPAESQGDGQALRTTQAKTPAAPTPQAGNCPKCGSGVVYTNDDKDQKTCCHCGHRWSGNFF